MSISMRRVHRWVGVSSALFGIALAVTGVILSVDPVAEAATTGTLTDAPEITVAELLSLIHISEPTRPY